MAHQPKLWSQRHAENQEILEDFLLADIEICFETLRSCAIENSSHSKRLHSALDKVRKQLRTIRALECRVEDSGIRKVVHDRATDLERAFEASGFATSD